MTKGTGCCKKKCLNVIKKGSPIKKSRHTSPKKVCKGCNLDKDNCYCKCGQGKEDYYTSDSEFSSPGHYSGGSCGYNKVIQNIKPQKPKKCQEPKKCGCHGPQRQGKVDFYTSDSEFSSPGYASSCEIVPVKKQDKKPCKKQSKKHSKKHHKKHSKKHHKKHSKKHHKKHHKKHSKKNNKKKNDQPVQDVQPAQAVQPAQDVQSGEEEKQDASN
jgi:hypothetical protein